MKQITMLSISHDQQRYETIGDWLYPDKNELLITVSKMDDWRYEVLVAVHELVEAVLCQDRDITQEEVDEFDLVHKNEEEPGDNPEAPYHAEHVFAGNVERLLAHELGVEWSEYEEAIAKLG